MANPSISACKIKEVLRLRHTAELNYRQLAASLYIAYGAVAKDLHRAAAASLPRPLGKSLSEGTGLGLSISRDIISNFFGGTITTESIPGQETTFVLRLPQVRSNTDVLPHADWHASVA